MCSRIAVEPNQGQRSGRDGEGFRWWLGLPVSLQRVAGHAACRADCRARTALAPACLQCRPWLQRAVPFERGRRRRGGGREEARAPPGVGGTCCGVGAHQLQRRRSGGRRRGGGAAARRESIGRVPAARPPATAGRRGVGRAAAAAARDVPGETDSSRVGRRPPAIKAAGARWKSSAGSAETEWDLSHAERKWCSQGYFLDSFILRAPIKRN